MIKSIKIKDVVGTKFIPQVVYFDYKYERIILAGIDSTNKIYKSDDYGKTWTLVYQHSNTFGWFSSWGNNSGTIVLGSELYGVSVISNDSGLTWNVINSLPNIRVMNFTNNLNGDIIACMHGKEIYKSINNGINWNLVYTLDRDAHLHGCYYDRWNNVYWITTGDENDKIIKMSSNFTTIEQCWNTIIKDISWQWLACIPTQYSILLSSDAGGNVGILRSDRTLSKYEVIGLPQTMGAPVNNLYHCSTMGELIAFFGKDYTNFVWSSDGGNTFNNINVNGEVIKSACDSSDDVIILTTTSLVFYSKQFLHEYKTNTQQIVIFPYNIENTNVSSNRININDFKTVKIYVKTDGPASILPVLVMDQPTDYLALPVIKHTAAGDSLTDITPYTSGAAFIYLTRWLSSAKIYAVLILTR